MDMLMTVHMIEHHASRADFLELRRQLPFDLRERAGGTRTARQRENPSEIPTKKA
jgi:hypothetical protein